MVVSLAELIPAIGGMLAGASALAAARISHRKLVRAREAHKVAVDKPQADTNPFRAGLFVNARKDMKMVDLGAFDVGLSVSGLKGGVSKTGMVGPLMKSMKFPAGS